MFMREKYQNIISQNFREEIESLQALLQINSEEAEAVTNEDGSVYPFGEGVQKAFQYTLDLGEKNGFVPTNIDNYGGHLDFGDSDQILGIIGHLDVVPAGEGWAFDAYSGAVSNGYIYGRGTTDDKGPVIACLYAMKALKEAGYIPSKRIRLILGLDEETNWKGLDYYLEHVKELPDYGFTPDGEFPVINGEKGILNLTLVKKVKEEKTKGLSLRKLEGGSAPNMVAEKARCVINHPNLIEYEKIKEKLFDFISEKDFPIFAKGIGKSLEISAEGKAAHGASPEKGLNAISILLDFLGRLDFAQPEVNDFIKFYNSHLGFSLNGEKINCGFQDEKSGKTTINVGLISMEKNTIEATLNVRYPISVDSSLIYERIGSAIKDLDMGMVKSKAQEPIFMDTDNNMVKTFMEVYQQNTGDLSAKPLVIGGGTYSRAFKNMLAFGAMFPNDPDLMHQRDEKLEISKLELMTRIYADAIYKLTLEDFKFN